MPLTLPESGLPRLANQIQKFQLAMTYTAPTTQTANGSTLKYWHNLGLNFKVPRFIP
jgi:hypothetical protein